MPKVVKKPSKKHVVVKKPCKNIRKTNEKTDVKDTLKKVKKNKEIEPEVKRPVGRPRKNEVVYKTFKEKYDNDSEFKKQHLNYMREKIKCECGVEKSRCNLGSHRNGKIHTNRMKAIKNENKIKTIKKEAEDELMLNNELTSEEIEFIKKLYAMNQLIKNSI